MFTGDARPHGRLAQIMLYPLKSAAGDCVPEAEVQPWGLRGDRRWALVDAHGGRLRAKRNRRIMAITARPAPGGGLRLSAPGRPELAVEVPTGPDDKIQIDMYDLDWALGAGPSADAWVSGVVGEPARLIWLDDPVRRPVAPTHGRLPGDLVSLADVAPLLMITTASLRLLDEWIVAGAAERDEPAPAPLDPRRFRPNVVLETDEPFAEDGWARFRIGDVAFRLAERCDRCAITLVEPDTLALGKEPLRTLARHRRLDSRTYFGNRVVPEHRGTLRLGAPVGPA